MKGAAQALAAAALFGMGAPVAKLLLPSTGPLMLAALLYLGAGTALLVLRTIGRLVPAIRFQNAGTERDAREAPIRRSDAAALTGVIVAGGMLGPWLMLIGLRHLSASVASLLLNLEAPLTMILAVMLFREHLARAALFGALLIITGAVILAYRPGGVEGDWLGYAAIAAACTSWAIDNNLSQRLSLRDPATIVQIKGLAAGACMLLIASASGQPFPAAWAAIAGLLLGTLSYGMSLVLAMRALRLLGSAREAAYFATAPFIGAALSIPLLRERLDVQQGIAALAMAAGVAFLVAERHAHLHTHEELEHEHAHTHDEHHRHAHDGPYVEPHSHPHRHPVLTHDHPHVSDIHHRHRHR